MKKLSVRFTKLELILGWIYMVLQLLALPLLFNLANILLGEPMNMAELNFCFFCFNFLCATIIFRKYLLGNLKIFFARPLRSLFSAVIGFVGYWAISFVLSMIIFMIYPDFSNVNDDTISIMVQENFALMSIGTVVLVPITEELLFRGLIFRGIYNRSRFWAYAISAVAFSLPHVVGYIGMFDPLLLLLCFVQYLPAGLCLSWAYARADSIFAPVLMHMVINLIGMFAMR